MIFEEFEKIALREFPSLTEIQLSHFREMESLYREWNSKINVISRKDMDGLYSHHVLHSLSIASYLKRECPELDETLRSGSSVLDLGTGGGFPGIPLAIMYPKSKFTLCDSVGKKTIVASAVVQALGLENCEVVNQRAENLDGKFDYVVSRAVAGLEPFYQWIRGKYSKAVFYLKGGDVAEEIAGLMGRFRLPKGAVHSWPVNIWLDDTYYDGKFVIHID